MNLFYMVGCLLLILGIVPSIIGIFSKKNIKFQLKKHRKDKYAILIPARDESKVIENLLKSIQVQNEDMSNVYVIVEDKEDSTCKITKKYGANIFVRPQPIRPRKGYALDECLQYVLKKEHYDLYFIFDADNVLDENFISKMLDAWHNGYDVAIGYRNILNPKNLVSCCSGIMFILLNRIMNKDIRMKCGQPVMLSGTGFYISGELIEKWEGFPFYTLTEDYELSSYLYNHNIASTYVEDAIYYDEQPLTMSVSIKQRTRWLKGFFEKRQGKLKDEKYSFLTNLGVLPIVLIAVSVIFLFLISCIDVSHALINDLSISMWKILLLGIPLWLYLSFLIVSIYALHKEKSRINLPKKLRIPSLLFMPLFLMTFAISFFRSVFLREVKWEKVEHLGE